MKLILTPILKEFNLEYGKIKLFKTSLITSIDK